MTASQQKEVGQVKLGLEKFMMSLPINVHTRFLKMKKTLEEVRGQNFQIKYKKNSAVVDPKDTTFYLTKPQNQTVLDTIKMLTEYCTEF